jgi:hypothetical protein
MIFLIKVYVLELVLSYFSLKGKITGSKRKRQIHLSLSYAFF